MDSNDLRILLQSKISLLVMETYDESRALSLLQSHLKGATSGCWRWSATDGLRSLGFGLELEGASKHEEPEAVLKHIKASRPAAAYVLCDLHPYLDEPKIVRLIKDIVLPGQGVGHKLILLSHRLTLPPELSRYAASLKLSLPTEDEILSLIRQEAKLWSERNGGQRIQTDNVTLKKLVNNLKGLPHQDVRRLVHGAVVDDGAITECDLPEVTRAKFELMDMQGILHYEYSLAHLNDVAGLEKLKTWLSERRQAFLQSEQDERKLDLPKGVLLFGVQGGGKSLAAKAIAGIWGLPLLRLDMAGLFNKYVGETERNLREALKLADVMAPCVLWIDELEKGLAQGDAENGIAKRLLGTFLTWMSERKSAVFIVATSNNISQLPPELVRKGRFDEIFFVDLPDALSRRAIFHIHLTRRAFNPADFNLALLTGLSSGFTGAEIEQVVVAAVYAAAAEGAPLSTAQLERAISRTQPLSVVMAEQIAELRAWAAERAVFAN